MSIEVVDKNIINEFPNGEIVFRITARNTSGELPISNERNVHIVTSLEDYKKKMHSHLYTPLLFTCNLPTRLAYLYGCLNYSYNHPRSEIYTFWWRKIGTDDWNIWFRVNPYTDSGLTE